MSESSSVSFEVLPGTTISRAVLDAVGMANSTGRQVRFEFNGIQMVANPGDLISDVAKPFDAAMRDARLRSERRESLEKSAIVLLSAVADGAADGSVTLPAAIEVAVVQWVSAWRSLR